MSGAFTVRRWGTWIFFIASLMALVAAGETSSMAIASFGVVYPYSLTPRLPTATQQLLDNSWLWTSCTTPAAVVAVLFAYLMMRRVRSPEAAYHYLSLLALLIYHLAFLVILSFTAIFFILPRALAHM